MHELKKLTESIHQSVAVENKFFNKWLANQLSIEELAVFVRNYWEWTYCFPEALAGLLSKTKDVKARVEYAKILFSEIGNGQINKVHSVLFEEFCNQLSEKLGHPGYLEIKRLQQNVRLLKTTQDLTTWQKETYLNTDMAAGAQLALEWQAYTMIRQLYEGARNYMYLWDNPDEFYEACEFFYVHIGAAEKDHKEESILAAQQLIDNGADLEKIKAGFSQNLHLIGGFWNGIAEYISC